MSGPYAAAFLIKGSYGELTRHPALRGHLPPRGKASLSKNIYFAL